MVKFLQTVLSAVPLLQSPFSQDSLFPQAAPKVKPYCLAGSSCFPSSANIDAFNASIHGRLLTPSQPALPCYAGPGFDAVKCEEVRSSFANPAWRADQPGAVQYTNWNGDGSIATCPLPAANSSDEQALDVAGCKQGRAPSYFVDAHTVHDIVSAVKFASKHHLRLRVRSTGHDYLGRSSGEGSFTISTHRLKSVRIEKEWKSYCSPWLGIGARRKCRKIEGQPAIVAGSGLYVEDLFKAAHENNVTVVGGASRTVGATGGWVLGGGHGPLGRLYGMGVDNVLQMTVVTADGKVRIANEFENSDLFWALRGGGGAFGVIVEVVLKAHPKLQGVIGIFGQTHLSSPDVYPQFLEKWMKAHRAFDAVQMTGYNFLVYPTSIFAYFIPVPASAPSEGGLEVYENKAKEAFKDVLDWASTTANVTMDAEFFTSPSWFEFWDGPFDKKIGELDAVGLNLMVASRLITRNAIFSDDKLSPLIQTLSNIHTPLITHFLAGGKISTISPSSTSLNPAWRDSLFVIEPVVTWANDAPSAKIQGTQSYLTNVTDRIGQVSGFEGQKQYGYSNEADPNEEQWQYVFWGKEHYEQLMEIKMKYDRHGLFTCYKCVGSDVFGS